jgi:transcriptional regulator with XRE-family HTH domain
LTCSQRIDSGCISQETEGYMASFGERLRAYRERAALSQSALAQAAGIDKSYVSRLENGQREVASRSLAIRLAAILHLSPSEVDLWLISAGYVSPRVQQLATRRASRLLEAIDVLSETSAEERT